MTKTMLARLSRAVPLMMLACVLARLERRRFRRQLAVALTFGALSALRGLVSPLLGRVTRTLSRAFVD